MQDARLQFLKWDTSETGQFSAEHLQILRDAHPDDIASLLYEAGSYAQCGALAEYLTHGNPRKAAMVAQSLVRIYPVCEQSMRENWKDLADYFLCSNPMTLPSSPDDYPE